MSTAEINRIKSGLIEWINQLSDFNLLDAMDKLKKSRSKEDWWDELSEDDKKNILSGLEDSDQGRVMSSKEFWSRLMNE